MTDQVTEGRKTTRRAWGVSLLAAVVAWLVWQFGVEAFVLSPDVTTTLLGFSVAANVGLVIHLGAAQR